jgi:signal transduction histidine kinase
LSVAEETDFVGSFEANRRRVVELEAIARIASAFTFEQALEAMMDEVASQVVQASSAALACIVGAANRSTQLVERVVGSRNLPYGFRETLEGAWRNAGAPLVSTSIQTRRTQVFDLSTILQRDGYEGVREAQNRAGWAMMAVVPMVYRGEAVGLLIVPYPIGEPPDEHEVSFLEAISDQAAVAFENARLFEHARQAAVTEERQRISRELHDSVSQALYGISLGAQTARELLDIDPSSAREPIEYVQALAVAGLAEMRAMIFELRPEALETEGLVAALGRQAAAVRARHKLTVEDDLPSEPDIAIDAKQMLYRVCQEALQNAVKHARATHLSLRLANVSNVLTLEIRDNGRGFDAGASFPGHLGLTSMRERAQREGGVIEIESEPGAGTLVRVRLGKLSLPQGRPAPAGG